MHTSVKVYTSWYRFTPGNFKRQGNSYKTSRLQRKSSNVIIAFDPNVRWNNAVYSFKEDQPGTTRVLLKEICQSVAVSTMQSSGLPLGLKPSLCSVTNKRQHRNSDLLTHLVHVFRCDAEPADYVPWISWPTGWLNRQRRILWNFNVNSLAGTKDIKVGKLSFTSSKVLRRFYCAYPISNKILLRRNGA